MDWSQSSLQPAFLNGIFWGFYRTPEAQRDPSATGRSLEQCTRDFSVLDRHLQDRAFMLGDTLTLADIPIATNLYRYFSLEIERPRLPNVEAWYGRLQERPAYRQHVVVPFQELFGRLDYWRSVYSAG